MIHNHLMSFLFQVTPPFKPQVMNETDTSNFDFEFTGASVELTPPEHDDGPSEYGTIAEAAGEETDEPFSQFSYDPGASVMTNSSSLQSRSVIFIRPNTFRSFSRSSHALLAFMRCYF